MTDLILSEFPYIEGSRTAQNTLGISQYRGLPQASSVEHYPRREKSMKRNVLAFMLIVLIVALISGCDSGQVSEPAKSEPKGGEAVISAESESEATMETAAPATEPVALLAPDDAAGAEENKEGVDHYQQGHWEVAQEHFQKAIAANANLAEAHYNLALTLDKLGHHGEATTHFQKALDLAPDNPSIKDSGILQAHVGG